MAIYGIGAYYPPNDISNEFIAGGYITIGWDIQEAPSLYEIMRHIKIGDIIYIKSMPIGQGLRIKAIGLVTDLSSHFSETEENGKKININWRWEGLEIIYHTDDKYNVRNNTLYEEYNPMIQKRVIALMCS